MRGRVSIWPILMPSSKTWCGQSAQAQSAPHQLNTPIGRSFTPVKPCFVGGNPDCSECGLRCECQPPLASWQTSRPGMEAGHLIDLSLAIERRYRERLQRGSTRNAGRAEVEDLARL